MKEKFENMSIEELDALIKNLVAVKNYKRNQIKRIEAFKKLWKELDEYNVEIRVSGDLLTVENVEFEY